MTKYPRTKECRNPKIELNQRYSVGEYARTWALGIRASFVLVIGHSSFTTNHASQPGAVVLEHLVSIPLPNAVCQKISAAAWKGLNVASSVRLCALA